MRLIFRRFFLNVLLAIAFPAVALAQSAILQGGGWTTDHVPMYSGSPAAPVLMDSGTSNGGAAGVNPYELGITSKAANGVTTAPYANSGNGPYSTHFCMFDAPTNSSAGYHSVCLDPNAQGGGLLSYSAGGIAAALPFSFIINGTTLSLSATDLYTSGDGTMALGAASKRWSQLFLHPTTVSTLTSAVTCAASTEGALASVTDATSTTFNAAISGGGSNHVLAYCNGTGWTVH